MCVGVCERVLFLIICVYEGMNIITALTFWGSFLSVPSCFRVVYTKLRLVFWALTALDDVPKPINGH